MKCITRWFAVLGLISAVGSTGAPVRAQTEKVLYKFSGGTDGTFPDAGLIRDKKGNLYGTTYQGGTSGSNIFGGTGFGMVFKLDKKGHESVLYTFTGGADGAGPLRGSLIMDKKGNLYGTTFLGGASGTNYLGSTGFGVVYRLSPPYGQGSETVLYTFSGGADGYGPLSSLIRDAQGNLYGTTFYGGAGYGVVFKLSPPSGGGAPWNETVLYTFTGGADGLQPNSVIMDAQGNLYGTTQNGGNTGIVSSGAGVVFELSPPYGQSSYTPLYVFNGGTDGAIPNVGSLIRDKQGNLYGTTDFGGTTSFSNGYLGPPGAGVVFKLVSPYGQGSETVLYAFSGGADGDIPNGISIDKHGTLYGTTVYGGNTSIINPHNQPPGAGVVFKLVSLYGQSNETVLYTFQGGADGWGSEAGVIMDKKGKLYGTTDYGGNTSFHNNGYTGAGVVFEITP